MPSPSGSRPTTGDAQAEVVILPTMSRLREKGGAGAALALGLLLTLLIGCATTGSRPTGRTFAYFAPALADPDADPWFPKVEEWQSRAQREGTRLPAADVTMRAARRSGNLLLQMAAFRNEHRDAAADATPAEQVQLARKIHDWSLRLGRRHYKWDPGDNHPEWDRWPTVGELLANNGDDCDGLDLIAYQLMRELGFPREQLYRGILRRDRDGANHMVTLWFQDPNDPWVVDVTGAVAVELHRLSRLPGWTPTKVFNEREQYTVLETTGAAPIAAGE